MNKDNKMECIFCKIIDGEIPAVKVLDEELVIAFMDIKATCWLFQKDMPRISLRSPRVI